MLRVRQLGGFPSSALGFSNVWVRVGRNTGIALGAQAVVAICGLVALYFNARGLGVAGLGVLALLISTAALLQRFLSTQSWQAVVALGQSRESEIFGAALLFDFAAACVAALIGLAVVHLIVPDEALLASAIFMLTVATRVQEGPMGILRLCDRFDLIAAVQIAQALLTAAIAPILYAGGAALSTYILAAAAVGLFGNLAMLAVGCAKVRPNRPPRLVLKQFVGFAIPAGLSGSIMAARQHGIVLLLGLLLGSASVGVFSIISAIANALGVVQTAIHQAVFREAASAEASSRLILVTGAVGLSVASAVGLVFYVFGDQILELAAGVHLDARLPLLVLVLSYAIAMLSVGLRAVITTTLGPKVTLMCNAVALMSLVSAPLLIVQFGVTGAAICHVIFDLAWLVIAFLVYRSRRSPALR